MLEYTTPLVSDQLVSAGSLTAPRTIVDFCAGNGNLLTAAKNRWPSAKLFANDIDEKVFGAIPQAFWTKLDFLSPSFKKDSEDIFPGSFDLVLLNPPFSMHQTQLYWPRGTFSDIRCSLAFAFLFNALEYVGDCGELLAIMPTSSLRSERDAKSRERLRQLFSCDLVSGPSYDRFPGLDVSTYLVRIRRRRQRAVQSQMVGDTPYPLTSWSISRGAISVRRSERILQRGLHGWVHTTSIINSRVSLRYELPANCSASKQFFVPKGSLLVPRVGKVKPGDLIVTKRREILSDCLFGVTFKEDRFAVEILEYIKKNFNDFLKIYAGTGAPYTTRHRLSRFITDAVLMSVYSLDERYQP